MRPNLSVWLGPVDPARVSIMSGTNFMAISTTVLSRLPSSFAKGFASSMSFVRFSSAGADPNFLAYSSAEYLGKHSFQLLQIVPGPTASTAG